MSFFRSNQPEVFLWKGIPQICSKITKEHPCQSVIIVTLLCNFIEITLQHRCSLENFINIFRKPLQINTCGLLLLLFSLITEILERRAWRCFIKVSSTKRWNLEKKKRKCAMETILVCKMYNLSLQIVVSPKFQIFFTKLHSYTVSCLCH